MTRPQPPRRAAAAIAALVVALAVVAGGCATSPDTQTGEPSVSFQSELQEAEKMVADASAIAGVDVAPVHSNTSGGNLAGAPDPSTKRRDVQVQWVSAEPPPFAAIRDLWTGTYGYTVTSESPDDVFLSKGEMRASIGQGLAAADGRRNVFFGVVTGLHPASEVPEPG